MNQPMTPDEEHEFYDRPENQQPKGPARRRLTATVPVRFPTGTAARHMRNAVVRLRVIAVSHSARDNCATSPSASQPVDTDVIPALFTRMSQPAPTFGRRSHQSLGCAVDSQFGRHADRTGTQFRGPLVHAIGGGAQHHPSPLVDQLTGHRCAYPTRGTRPR